MYDLKATIIKLREERKWNQAELARRSVLSAAAISDIEAGKKTPNFDSLMKIAYAFGMDLVDLLARCKKESINIDALDAKTEIIEWALKQENEPYLRFALNLSKEVPAESLGKLKFFRELEIKPGGQNDGGK